MFSIDHTNSNTSWNEHERERHTGIFGMSTWFIKIRLKKHVKEDRTKTNKMKICE